MPSQRKDIARAVAQRLFAAEEALDLAAARIAELNAALPLARLDARLAVMVGQDAFNRSASAMVLVAQTREEIVAAHACLKRASDGMGMGAISYGDLLKPPSALQSDAPGTLRSVA